MRKNSSRTQNSIRNICVSVSCQFLTLLFSFFSRTVFIQILGAEYLGINGLFQNILSVMSLADLGFGTAIIYALYKPLADNNTYKVTQIIKFFNKIYNIIALSILIIGISLIPFLQYLVNLENDIPHLKFYYFLFLLETVCSYFVVHKSALLNADQKNYIVKMVRTIFNIISHVLKLVLLYITKSFTIYVISGVFCVITSNIVIQIIANKKYPYINKKVNKLEKSDRKDIIENVKSLFLYRIGGVILNNTDNLLISTLVNTVSVGYFSNYTLLFGTVQTFSELIFGSLSASVGNQYASKDNDKIESTFKMLNLANFWVYGFCSITLYCLMSDFIKLWLGNEFIFDNFTVFIFCLNIYIAGMMSSVVTIRTATGLFKKTKYVFCITAVLNIIFSILLGKKFGIAGIIGATIISRLLTNVWFEPLLIYRDIFKKSSIKYFVRQIFYLILFIAPCYIITIIKLYISSISFSGFILEFALCIIFINCLFYFIFKNNNEFLQIKTRIINFLKSKIYKNI